MKIIRLLTGFCFQWRDCGSQDRKGINLNGSASRKVQWVKTATEKQQSKRNAACKHNRKTMGIFDKIKTKTDEFARVIEWTPQWDTGAPMPQVFSNGHMTFLIYLINEPDQNGDGTYVNMIDNASEKTYPLALVVFSGHTFRFGIANDEVYSGLPLWDKGLEGYAAHIIENSTWINELKNINKVHPYYNEDRWKDRKHFALLFHDEIFEIIATDYKIEKFKTTFGQLATEVARRMNK